MLEQLLARQILMKASGNLLCAAAMCPPKREKWWVRLLQCAALALLCAGVCLLDDWLVFQLHLGTTVQPLICIAVNVLYLTAVRRMPLRQALFCSAWANMTMEMACQIFFVFERTVLRQISGDAFALAKLAGVLLTVAAMYFLVRLVIAKWLRTDGKYPVSAQNLLYTVSVMAIFLVATNYQFIFWLLGFEPMQQSAMIEAFRLASGFMCIAMLSLQNMLEKKRQTSQELAMIRQMFYRQQEQFELSKENIDIINRKCHDMKHQIAALKTIRDQAEIDRQVEEMEKAVMIYDSAIHTGNPVLDVVLTEKSLYCEAHQINLTCLVDGKMLSFVETVDLYTLFGNALDNAIESVMQQLDKQKRVIQVAAYEEQGMLMIRFRNYCDRAPELVDGLPVTTKQNEDYHGFGLKSIRYTAEKYGGGMNIQTGSNFFSLQILLPIQKNI